MGAMASQITGLTIVYSTVHSGADQRKHQRWASLAYVREFTGDRWIPHTNGQLGGNISSWWRHHVVISLQQTPIQQKDGLGRPNIQMSSYQYRDPRVKDKTVAKPSYLSYINPTPGLSLYWNGGLVNCPFLCLFPWYIPITTHCVKKRFNLKVYQAKEY